MATFGPLDLTEPRTFRAKCTSPTGQTDFSGPFTVTPSDDCGGGACQITANPDPIAGVDGTNVPVNMGGSATGPVQWQFSNSTNGPWLDVAGPPSTVSGSTIGFWRFCCVDDSTVCSDPAEVSLTNAVEFAVAGSTILTPCGTDFYGMGMNAAANVTDGPFVFEGVQGGGGTCDGAIDIWPNDQNNNGCYPGGGLNSRQKFSPQGGGLVQLPDRIYALNGNLTASAQAAGIVQPADDWRQNVVRFTFVCQGAPPPPDEATMISEAIAAIQELVDGGIVVVPEAHDLTGDDIFPTAAWNADGSSFSGEFGCAVRFNDALIEAFKTDGSGTGSGSANVKKGYVWFNPTNEPTTGADQAVWEAQAEFWLRRIRDFHGARNVTVLDINNYGQDLSGLATGRYDNWYSNMQAAGLTDELVLGWHAYGADPDRNIGYTYANMDADLNTVLNTGSPAGHVFPIMIGEYGQAKVVGGGNAGPDQWNRNAFEYLATSQHGQPLMMKYPQTIGMVWHGTGDGAFWSSQYTLTIGTGATNNDGLSQPFWDIQSGNDPLLSPLGSAHWDISHQRAALSANCGDLI